MSRTGRTFKARRKDSAHCRKSRRRRTFTKLKKKIHVRFPQRSVSVRLTKRKRVGGADPKAAAHVLPILLDLWNILQVSTSIISSTTNEYASLIQYGMKLKCMDDESVQDYEKFLQQMNDTATNIQEHTLPPQCLLLTELVNSITSVRSKLLHKLRRSGRLTSSSSLVCFRDMSEHTKSDMQNSMTESVTKLNTKKNTQYSELQEYYNEDCNNAELRTKFLEHITYMMSTEIKMGTINRRFTRRLAQKIKSDDNEDIIDALLMLLTHSEVYSDNNQFANYVCDYLNNHFEQVIEDVQCLRYLKKQSLPCLAYLILPSYKETYLPHKLDLLKSIETFQRKTFKPGVEQTNVYRTIDYKEDIKFDDVTRIEEVKDGNTIDLLELCKLSLSFNTSPFAAILSCSERDGSTACSYLLHCLPATKNPLYGFNYEDSQSNNYEHFLHIPDLHPLATLFGYGELWHVRSKYAANTHYEEQYAGIWDTLIPDYKVPEALKSSVKEGRLKELKQQFYLTAVKLDHASDVAKDA